MLPAWCAALPDSCARHVIVTKTALLASGRQRDGLIGMGREYGGGGGGGGGGSGSGGGGRGSHLQRPSSPFLHGSRYAPISLQDAHLRRLSLQWWLTQRLASWLAMSMWLVSKIKMISLASCTALLVGYHARTKFGRDIRLVRVIVS